MQVDLTRRLAEIIEQAAIEGKQLILFKCH